MKKSGFTLVELLAVIVLLGVVSLVIIPKVGDSITNSRNRAYDAQIVSIKKGVNDFLIENSSFLSYNDTITLTLGVIKQAGYLPVNIKNPITRNNFSNQSKIIIKKNNDSYDIELELIDLVDVTEDLDVNSPILALNGEYIQYINVNGEYKELGASALSSDGKTLSDISKQIKLGETEVLGIDTSSLNTYTVIYSVTDSGYTTSATRTVMIVDTEAPVLSFPSETVISIFDVDNYDLMKDVIVSDNYDNNVSVDIESDLTNKVGKYVITYTATDSSNNKTVERRVINIVDENVFDTNYEQLDYIQTNGSQYIVFDYKVKKNSKLKLDIQFIENKNTDVETANNTFIGKDDISSDNTFTANFGANIDQKNIIFYWIDKTYASGADTYCIEYNSVLNRSIMTLKSGSVNYQGVTSSIAVKRTDTPSNLVLFGVLSSSADEMKSFNRYDVKLYSFQIYEDDNLIKDLIPCYRKSDGVAGLYDLINNVFYDSDGVSEFLY